MHCGARGSACRSVLKEVNTTGDYEGLCLWSQLQQGQWAGSCRVR
jgi:hypothetical protein